MLIIDDFSRMIWVSFLREKSKDFEKFKEFKDMAENKTDCKIQSIRSHNGGEFTSKEFDEFCKSNGIRRKFTVEETLQQIDVVERENILVQQLSRAMMTKKNV